LFNWRYHATTIMTILTCLLVLRSHNPPLKPTAEEDIVKVYSVALDSNWCLKPDQSKQFVIPNLKSTAQLLDECLVDSYAVYRAIYVFYENWKSWFGDEGGEVDDMINNLLIEWGDKKRTVRGAYDIHGNYIPNASVVGLAISPNHLWAKRGKKGIGTSSLVHELVHLALWNIHGSADPTHEGGEDGLWTEAHTEFIKETNDLLFLIGDRSLADPNYSMDTLRSVMESYLKNGENSK